MAADLTVRRTIPPATYRKRIIGDAVEVDGRVAVVVTLVLGTARNSVKWTPRLEERTADGEWQNVCESDVDGGRFPDVSPASEGGMILRRGYRGAATALRMVMSPAREGKPWPFSCSIMLGDGEPRPDPVRIVLVKGRLARRIENLAGRIEETEAALTRRLDQAGGSLAERLDRNSVKLDRNSVKLDRIERVLVAIAARQGIGVA
ncbi:MAG: hypothetical protein A2Y78_11255 [Acidobacteria bacterium RBG_13_68_16]|nr:MAG: hypothetical protein A2Y78_11255 [Acidobacteria bacterium RBG_13_68_16]